MLAVAHSHCRLLQSTGRLRKVCGLEGCVELLLLLRELLLSLLLYELLLLLLQGGARRGGGTRGACVG